MLCVIRSICNLYNLKNMKNTHEGVLLLVKLQIKAYDFTRSNSLQWVFITFFWIIKMVPNYAKHHKWLLDLNDSLGKYLYRQKGLFNEMTTEFITD